MASIRVLGVQTFSGTLHEAVRTLVEDAGAGAGGFVCLGNVHVLVSARHDPALQRALADARTVLPDGAPVAWLQRRAGHAEAERVGGPDLMPRVWAEGRARGLRHFLYGSTPEVVARVRERLGEAQVVGSYAPGFDPHDAADAARGLEAIRAARPDVVWVALGAPRQELWMHAHARELAPATLVGVGAAFDFLAGTKPRAPRWMQRSGLEWLHRLSTEPRRLAGRYVRTNSEFLVLAARELVRGR